MSRVILAIFLFATADCYKILVYNPKIGHSHVNFVGRIADILVEAGHDVTTLIPIVDPSLVDGTTKSKKVHVQPHDAVREQFEGDKFNLSYFEFAEFNPIVPFIVGPILAKPMYLTCEKVVSEPGLIEGLRDQQFDVMITEDFDVCGMGISDAIAPGAVIGLSSSFINGLQFSDFGVPEATSHVPSKGAASLDVHSFSSRFFNALDAFLAKVMFVATHRWTDGVLRRRFGPDYPSVAEQSANVAYLMVNAEPLLDYAGPTMSRVIHIGGVTAMEPKPLDEYWSGVLSLRPRSVLISFGTVAESTIMLPEMKRSIAKYEKDDEIAKEVTVSTPNLVLSKWTPQVDLLNDDRLHLFITHAGMGSTLEAACRGVPGVYVPLFGDQLRNAGMMARNGLGKIFPKSSLVDDKQLTTVVRETLDNDEYRRKSKEMARKLAAKPFSARELLVKHVEFAAEFGASRALRPQSVDMSFIEYNNLDITLIFTAATSIFAVISFKIAVCLARKAFCQQQKAKID